MQDDMSFHPFRSSRYRKESDLSRYSHSTNNSDNTYVDSVRQPTSSSEHRHLGCFGIRSSAFPPRRNEHQKNGSMYGPIVDYNNHNHTLPSSKTAHSNGRSWTSKTLKSVVSGLAFDRSREKQHTTASGSTFRATTPRLEPRQAQSQRYHKFAYDPELKVDVDGIRKWNLDNIIQKWDDFQHIPLVDMDGIPYFPRNIPRNGFELDMMNGKSTTDLHC